MKKLICNKDIEKLQAEGQNNCQIDNQTLITPSARDLAAKFGIRFTEKSFVVSSPLSENMDQEQLCNFLRSFLENGGLSTLNRPYQAIKHAKGLKVVRGSSVKFDEFETGVPGSKVASQELVSKDEAKISAGFLTIDESHFPWELTYEEIDYVIEGTLEVEIEGEKFSAQAGDVMFIPAHSKVIFSSPNKAKMFYATYPANWADLV